ncbi:MAG: c-type cytochrome [Bryobacteraceae bacterium]|jgi:mono/diheme cytochrome c family protein
MKPILKWAGIVAASLAGLLVLAIAYVFIVSQRILDRSYLKRSSAVHELVTADAVARGAHLTVVSTCTDCHGKDLTGTQLPVPGSTVYAPNLTIMTKSLSDADIDLAIRQGLRSDGKSLLFMPSHGYASFTDDEVASIIGYLRSLSPQGTASPEPHLGLGVRVALVAGIVRTEAAEFADTLPPLDLGVRYENGRHLAQVVCGQCHGMNLSGEPKRPVRPTPDLLIVAGYDRGAFRTLMRTGRAPEGRQTVSMLRIAGNLSTFTDDETDAIYDYLVARWKALTAKQNAPGYR